MQLIIGITIREADLLFSQLRDFSFATNYDRGGLLFCIYFFNCSHNYYSHFAASLKIIITVIHIIGPTRYPTYRAAASAPTRTCTAKNWTPTTPTPTPPPPYPPKSPPNHHPITNSPTAGSAGHPMNHALTNPVPGVPPSLRTIGPSTPWGGVDAPFNVLVVKVPSIRRLFVIRIVLSRRGRRSIRFQVVVAVVVVTNSSSSRGIFHRHVLPHHYENEPGVIVMMIVALVVPVLVVWGDYQT